MMMKPHAISKICATAIAATLSLLLAATAHAADDWSAIRKELYSERQIAPPPAGLAFYAPAQAADGALVPISIVMNATIAKHARKLTIVIDRNPAPVAAVVNFGAAWRRDGEIGDRVFATRIRVDAFSNVRAILETDTQNLAMAAQFVAGAGGCTSLGSKDPASALARLGEVRADKTSDVGRAAAWREAVVKIRHPNFTGMQLDPATRAYTPARFVQKIDVRDGNELLVSIEGSISLSENPHIRLTYPGDDADITVDAEDSTGAKFSGRSMKRPS